MDPRSIRLTNRLNNEEEQILNIDSRVIADRQNIRRLDNEMTRQEQYTRRQELINNNSNRNHYINIAIFVLLGVLIIVIAVIASLAFERSHNANFADNSINANEIDNNDNFTMKSLKLTNGGNNALTIQDPGGITFGASQISANEFRVIDGAIAGTVVANKAIVVDENKNFHGLNYFSAGGASFSSGVCFKSLATFESGISVMGGSSFGSLTKFHNGICVTGITNFDGISVGGILYSYGGLCVSGTTNFSNLVTVESNTGLSIQGGVSMSGVINMYSQLNSTSGICISGGLSVNGQTRFYNQTRIQKQMYLKSSDLAEVPFGYQITKEQSGTEFFIDYSTKKSVQFKLPIIDTNDTGLQYDFRWAEGMSSADKHSFVISSAPNDYLSGSIFLGDYNTNVFTSLTSHEPDNSNSDYQLSLSSLIADGSHIKVKSYNGRWIVQGDLGVSTRGENVFQNHLIKEWIAGGVSDTNHNYIGDMVFSGNAQNWHPIHHLPIIPDNSFTTISDIAFGTSEDGTSTFVASSYFVGTNNGLIWSNTGTSWYTSTGSFHDTSSTGVAFGDDDNGNSLWVATGDNQADANKNLLWSSDGMCWAPSVASGDNFSLTGRGVAFGLTSASDERWVAVGQNANTNLYKNILWSNDGMCWAQSDASGTTFDDIGHRVAFGTSDNGDYLWVAVGKDNSDPYQAILWSTNGTCWAPSDGSGSKFASYANAIAFGRDDTGVSIWVAGSYDVENSVKPILWSTNGMCWAEGSGSVLSNFNCNDIAFGLSTDGTCMFVAVGYDQGGNYHNNILHSTDGKNWVISENGSVLQNGGYAVTYNRDPYPLAGNIINYN